MSAILSDPDLPTKLLSLLGGMIIGLIVLEIVPPTKILDWIERKLHIKQ